MVVTTQILTSLSSEEMLQELRLVGYKNVGDASLVPSSSAEPLNAMFRGLATAELSPIRLGEGTHTRLLTGRPQSVHSSHLLCADTPVSAERVGVVYLSTNKTHKKNDLNSSPP